MAYPVIYLHSAAPAKPPEGAVCNGCGLCCSVAPCPLGMWLSKKRLGTCVALSWDDNLGRYHCGVVMAPKRWLPWLPEPVARRWAKRWIAAASGCDSNLQPA